MIRAAERLANARPALDRQVAIVTGADKGLGAAIVEVLAGDGAAVVLAARDQEALDRRAALLDQAHPNRKSLVVRCDVTQPSQIDSMVKRTLEQFGGIDILVNAHGVIGPIETPAQNVTPSEFRDVLESNVVGVFLTCRAIIPHLINRRDGRIVNIAGTSGLRGYRNRISYSSSKWAVRGLTRTLAHELGPYGITANTVCPNVTHGRRMDIIVREKARKQGKTVEQVVDDYARETALKRFIDDVDVANAVRFLVSDGARNITGKDIIVDAGWSA